MIQRLLIFGATFFVGAVQISHARDWNQFRGPTGQGHAVAAELPTEWDSETNVVWKTLVAGSGWSSPVVKGGRIYFTAAVPIDPDDGPRGDLSLRLLGFDAANGEQVLDAEVFQQDAANAPRIHQKNSHASPTPIIDGDRIFVHFGHQGTACVSLDGEVLWQNRSLRYSPVHGNGGSPVLVDDLLVFSCDGSKDPFVVALNADDGTVRWKTARETDASRKFSFSTPLVITVAGRRQVISPGSNVVCGFDLSTGEEIWRLRYEGYSVIPRPVYGHGLIFIATGYNTPSVLAIRPDGKGDVTDTHLAWQLKKGAPHTPSLLLVEDNLFMVSDGGIASCVDAKSGAVHWQQRIGGKYSASPIYAGGLIYVQSEDGDGHVIRAGTEFESVSENPLGERTLASYAVDGDDWIIRGGRHLFRISEQ